MDAERGTRTTEVMAHVRARIARGALGGGDRLPSIRALAATLAVSPSTVVEAYDRLVAEGLIRPRPGSGFYVADAAPRLSFAATGPDPERDIDPWWVSRQSLDTDPALPKPGCGWLPADLMPEDSIRRVIRKLARADRSVLLDYGAARGMSALRQFLARQCAAGGLDVAPDQVLLTGSGSQALDLICRFLLRSGDTVLLDDPCYFNFRALLRAHHVNIVSAPYTAAGPDIVRFEEIVASHRPRLYITNSALHNPTGATLTPQVAHRVLTLAATHEMVIVEDDIFADFEPEPSPRLAALDGLNGVIRIGSFSKTLSASLRCGYIVGRSDWIEALTDLQVATNFGAVSPVAADIICSALSDGGYHKHMEALRRRLSHLRRETVRQLSPLGIVPWLMPRGGFYLWCHLPEGVDGACMARVAFRKNLVLAPGDVFSVTRSAGGLMRFNIAQMTAPGLCRDLRDVLDRVQSRD